MRLRGPTVHGTPHESLPRWRRFIADVTARGASVPAGHRLHAYVAAEESLLNEGFPADDASLRLLLSAKLELGILCGALESLSAPPEVPGWFQRLNRALPGPVLPQDSPDTPRDIMAELYFATRMRAAKQDIDLSQPEPDIVVRVGSRRYCFAVKRPRTWKSAEGAIRKAVHQIAASGLTGFVVLDLSLVLALHEQILWGTVDEIPAINAEIGRRIAELSRNGEGQRWVEKVTGHEKVPAMVVQAAVAVPDPSGRAVSLLRTMFRGTIYGFTDRRAAKYLQALFD